VSEKAAAIENNDITDTWVLVIQDFLEQKKELWEMQMKERSLQCRRVLSGTAWLRYLNL
jgi:hypothetical protein